MATISDVLFKRIAESEKSLNAIAKESGVDYAALHRFVNQGRNLQMHILQRLFDYFSLEPLPKGSTPPRTERAKRKGRVGAKGHTSTRPKPKKVKE